MSNYLERIGQDKIEDREEIEQLTTRVRELEEENARLHEQVDLQIPAIAFNQLTEQLAAAQEENARLNSEIEMLKSGKRSNIRLGMELAASQAYAEQLRVALNTAAEKFHDYAEFHSMKDRTRDNIEKTERNLDLARMCDKAIALPRDTSALDAYVAKRLHDMACDKGLLRIQVEELTRQRDLAVEWLERCAVHVRPTATIFYEEIIEALSTIKESEAMAQGEKK